MDEQPYIKIIRGGKEFTYTKVEWDAAWIAVLIIGFIAGIICTILIKSV